MGTTAEEKNYPAKNKGKGVGEQPKPEKEVAPVENYLEEYTDEDGKKIRIIYIEKDNIIQPSSVHKVLEEFINREFKNFIKQSMDATSDNVSKIMKEFQDKLEGVARREMEQVIMNVLSDDYQEKLEKMLEERIDFMLTKKSE